MLPRVTFFRAELFIKSDGDKNENSYKKIFVKFLQFKFYKIKSNFYKTKLKKWNNHAKIFLACETR